MNSHRSENPWISVRSVSYMFASGGTFYPARRGLVACTPGEARLGKGAGDWCGGAGGSGLISQRLYSN